MNTQRYLNAAHELKYLLHTALRNSSHFAGGNVRMLTADGYTASLKAGHNLILKGVASVQDGREFVRTVFTA
jgi:hypothetical protein